MWVRKIYIEKRVSEMEWEKSCMDSVVQRKTNIIDKYNWRGKMIHT